MPISIIGIGGDRLLRGIKALIQVFHLKMGVVVHCNCFGKSTVSVLALI